MIGLRSVTRRGRTLALGAMLVAMIGLAGLGQARPANACSVPCPKLPELHVSSTEVTWNPGDIRVAKGYYLNITITNSGNASAGAFQVAVTDVKPKTHPVGGLPVHGSVTIAHYLGEGVYCDQKVHTIVIDSTHAVPESNEANNQTQVIWFNWPC